MDGFRTLEGGLRPFLLVWWVVTQIKLFSAHFRPTCKWAVIDWCWSLTCTLGKIVLVSRDVLRRIVGPHFHPGVKSIPLTNNLLGKRERWDTSFWARILAGITVSIPHSHAQWAKVKGRKKGASSSASPQKAFCGENHASEHKAISHRRKRYFSAFIVFDFLRTQGFRNWFLYNSRAGRRAEIKNSNIKAN